ncbi:hypothetical protein [Burkholderia cenocepacia]
MSEIKDGGPAFPVPGLMEDPSFNGMTLRDYFAAKAMQAALTTVQPGPTVTHEQMFDAVAPLAYLMADAMLKARGEA